MPTLSDLPPLRQTVLRSLCVGGVVATPGTWTMQNTGAGWLMTSLPSRALRVCLTLAAIIMGALLPVSHAGVLANTLDRRRVLIASQTATMAAAAS